MIIHPDGRIEFQGYVDNETGLSYECNHDESVSGINIENEVMQIIFKDDSYIKCPVSVFLGDRLTEWDEYLAEHPDGYFTEGGIPIPYEYKYHWNTYDFYWAFTALTDFLKTSNYLCCKDIWTVFENYRIKNEMSFLCSNSGGAVWYHFHERATMREILFSVVHYYILNGYKLAKCKHCEKWFATKSLKIEYCERISPCYNMVVSGKPVLRKPQKCEQAVKTIKQRLEDRKESIYQNWYVNHPDKLYEPNGLLNEYTRLKNAMKAAPTVSNIVAFQEYLYSETMPKQTRPNRKHGGAYHGKHNPSKE